MDILRTERMLNLALFSIPKGGKELPSFYLALKAPIFTRNDNLISEESSANKGL